MKQHQKELSLGDRFYVSNPKGIKCISADGSESGVPQGTTLQITCITKESARLTVCSAEGGVLDIRPGQLQRNCKPERRFDGFHDPISPERNEQLLIAQDCPFRKTDTTNDARTLMMRAVRDKLDRVAGNFFHE